MTSICHCLQFVGSIGGLNKQGENGECTYLDEEIGELMILDFH